MTKPRLLYYQIWNYTPENLEKLHHFFEVTTLPHPGHDTPEILAETDAVLAPLGHFFGEEKMAMAPRLAAIGSNTTGHPHIDVERAAARGIRVFTLKEHQAFLDTITPTAELTLGLIIALTRHVLPASRSVLSGQWSRWPFGGERMLSRMRLGIIGLGRLGRKMAALGRALGMEVRYFDPFVTDPVDEKADSLEELVAACDVLTLHVPHEPAHEKMIHRRLFEQFKPGSFFVNTARGELVDEEALLWALESGRLAGAAVDVLSGEFAPDFGERVRQDPLVAYAVHHDNLIITPHIGGSTHDAWSLTQGYVIELLVQYFRARETP